MEHDGSGRLLRDTPGQPSIYLPPEEIKNVRAGDRLTVRLEMGRKQRIRGRVVSRGERASDEVVGVVVERAHAVFLEPEPPGPAIILAQKGNAKANDAVRVRVIQEARGHHAAVGEVIEVLGNPDSPAVQTEIVIRSQGLPMEFSDEALRQAEKFEAVNPDHALKDGRRDLRSITHVTIDGEDARDFDDAVAAQTQAGGIRVWVSIADVSSYVTEGSPLDADAQERGTSVYFPHRVIPMLPERLSNELCSLRPNEPRLCLTCEMTIDAEGRRHAIEVYPSLIRSAARLTYTQVEAVLSESADANNPACSHTATLKILLQAARSLRRRREQHGALDLDVPEAQIIVDTQGTPRTIRERPRLEAHRLIEDLMVAANESVAELLEHRQRATLFRVHEAPSVEKLMMLARWAQQFGLGFDVKKAQRPHVLATLSRGMQTLAQKETGHMLLLRSLAQARYAAENLGHYGLGSRAYTHFTSPIRRYPDLIVHRSLYGLWRHGEQLKQLPTIADRTSFQERRSMEAERAVEKLMGCYVATQHVGETYDGVITGVHASGAFVRLKEVFIEGLVPMQSLGAASGDYFDVLTEELALVGKRSGQRFTIGDTVKVRVASVNIRSRHIDFELVKGNGAPAPRRFDPNRFRPGQGRKRQGGQFRGKKKRFR